MDEAKKGSIPATITVVEPPNFELNRSNAKWSEPQTFNFSKKGSSNLSNTEDDLFELSSLAGDTSTEDLDEISFNDFDDDTAKIYGYDDTTPFSALNQSLEQNISDNHTEASPLFVGDRSLIVPKDTLQSESSEQKVAREQRLKVMEELVSSEQVYVSSLRIICEIFAPVLSNFPGIDTTVTILFNNVLHIYSLNRELLNELELRLIAWRERKSSTVADVFNEQMALFWFYSRFSVNLSPALEKIRACKYQETFRRSIEECERNREPLESLLIKPIQRIPRYILLLNDMARKSHPLDPDVAEIKTTVCALEKVADSLNESVREREGMDSLIKLQKLLGRKVDLVAPGRRILFDGMLWKVDRTGQPVRMHWHLFTDQLMFSRLSPLATGGLYKHRFLALKNLHVDWDTGGYNFENAFTIKSPRKSFVVFSDTDIGARKWYNAISAACQAYADDNGLAVAPVKSPHAANECTFCHAVFSILNKRHHCRACGAIVCSKCSNHREIVSAIDANARQRVCDSCFEDMQDDRVDDLPNTLPRPSKTRDMMSSWRNSMKKMISRHSASSASSDQSSIATTKSPTNDISSARASGARALSTVFLTRRDVVEELLRTENAFLDDISTTLDVIITPLVTQLRSSDSQQKIHPKLIAAFEALEMIRTWSQTVVADLDIALNRQSPVNSPHSTGRRISHPLANAAPQSPSSTAVTLGQAIQSSNHDPLIGDVFEKRCNLFALFSEYAEHLGSIYTASLHPDVESKVALLESDSRCGGIRFQRRLLIPLQRPSAYTFLLNKLIRLTDESHQDYKALQSAVDHTTAATKSVSSAMKAGNQRTKLTDLEAQFHGKISLTDETELIRTGKVSLFDAKERFGDDIPIPTFDQVTLHLFSNRLIVSHGDGKRGYKVEHDLAQSPDAWFEMDENAARSLSKAQPLEDGARYSVVRLHYGSRNIFGLVMKEPAQKRSWVNDLQRCIHRSSSSTV